MFSPAEVNGVVRSEAVRFQVPHSPVRQKSCSSEVVAFSTSVHRYSHRDQPFNPTSQQTPTPTSASPPPASSSDTTSHATPEDARNVEDAGTDEGRDKEKLRTCSR